MRNRVLILGAILFASLFANSNASAWHGYPPFGAWVYGSAPSYVARSRVVYRSRPTFPFGWGRVYSTRVSYGLHYRPYVRPYYVFPRHTYFYTPVVRVVRPVVPVFIAPTCITPTYSVGFTVASKSTSLPASTAIASTANLKANVFSKMLGQTKSNAVSAADTSFSSRLVSTNSKTVQTASPIPSELLKAADAILEAGGYTEASKAYAQLSVRYGSSHMLFGRRFVAQIAAGNLVQAEAILELARLHSPGVQFSIDGPLSKYVGEPVIEMRTEQLAKRAFERTTDSTPLRSLSHWLFLQGDLERAMLFDQRASQVDGVTDQPTPSQPRIARPKSSPAVDSLLLTAR